MPDNTRDNNLTERIEKIERIIYGTGLDDGLIYSIASIQQEIKTTSDQMVALQANLEKLTTLLGRQTTMIDKRIQEYDKRISDINKMVLKLVTISAGISASISLIIGIVISALLHI